MTAAVDAGLVQMERDALLSDGTTIRVRPCSPDDLDAVRQFYERGLSDRSSYLRFFGTRRHIPTNELSAWVRCTPESHVAVLAERDGVVVAVATYDVVSPSDGQGPLRAAEVAVAVTDLLQGHGIATVLLEDLARIATNNDIARFVAEELPDNRAMLKVFRDSGLPCSTRFDDGLLTVELDLRAVRELESWAHERDRRATVASMRHLLDPQTVVVIGASASGRGAGRRILDHLAATYTGTVTAVHPTASEMGGVRCVAAVTDLSGPIDLAVIAVPAEAVPAVLEECGHVGVASAVIISAGFGEHGHADLEAACFDIARRHGMRVVGPNCLGIRSSSCALDATFTDATVRSGGVALASQSGGLGIALLDDVAARGVGISSFVSLGNKIDVSSNDLLAYWQQDDATRVIALYLESFGNGRRFARLARSVSLQKPIVAVKSGRSEAGARSAAGHTAARTSPDDVVEAVFRAAGVLRVDTIEELIDVSVALDRQPLPEGPRVAVIGNAGGPLVMAADAASAAGLNMVVLSDSLRALITEVVPFVASSINPVDLLATVTVEQLERVVGLLAASGEVDAVIVVWVPLDPASRTDVLSVLDRLVLPIPVVGAVTGIDRERAGATPLYSYPESAVRVVRRLVERANWLQGVARSPQSPTSTTHHALRARLAERASPAGAWADHETTSGVLHHAGIRIPRWQLARSDDDVRFAVERLGSPLAIKAVGPLHKSDRGGVRLGVDSPDEAVRCVRTLRTTFGDEMTDVLVQEQCQMGVELCIGGLQVGSFGSVISIGAGGTDTELLDDRVTLLAPVSPTDALDALRQLRCWPLLNGYRGRPSVDVYRVVDVIVSISQLIDAIPEMSELEINPLIVTPHSVVAVDARLRLTSSSVGPKPIRGLRPALVD
jgi:acyl-CoA synthetase (NDP forming)/GNAT superfamily N-acetyltransferase